MDADQDLRSTVDALMDGLRSDLERLARIPSIACPGFPPEPVRRAHGLVVELLRGAGVEHIEQLDLPDMAPVVHAEIPPPTPAVLLSAHYDVQPPGDASLWRSPPFEPTPVEGGLRARGIADDKSNIVVHLGMLRGHGGGPPTGIKIVIEGQTEGQEEYGSVFDDCPPTDPERFARDAVIIADLGNIRPGSPTLTTGLRGASEVVVEVRTPAEARHSGECGGAALSALPVLLHALATLHHADGDVAVAGLRREAWSGTSCADEEFRDLAAVRDGVPLIGTGSLGERLWSGPAVTVIGVDAPSVDHAVSAFVPYARAEPNLRFPPQQDPREAQGALVAHVEALRPFGIPLTVTPGDAGPGFEPATGGPACRAALSALREGWGAEPDFVASGGSIPLVDGLAKAAPGAEVLLFGVQEGMCALHAPNERVLFSELRGGGLAEAAFLRGSAAAFGGRS